MMRERDDTTQCAEAAVPWSLRGIRVTILATAPTPELQRISQGLSAAGAQLAQVDPVWGLFPAADVVLVVLDRDDLRDRYVLEAIRASGPHTIGLADSDSLHLTAYLDDFICAPYSVSELAVRVGRALAKPAAPAWQRAGNISLDPASRRVLLGESDLQLTFHEFELLRTLLAARGAVLTRDQIATGIYGGEHRSEGGRGIDILIHHLRAKLGTSGRIRIQTIRGMGYRLDER